jgi:hypothetical protein
VGFIDSMDNNKNIITKFISSVMADYFFLALTCATAFTVGMCHWLLEIEYKYRENNDPSLGSVDFRWVFVACVIISLFYALKRQVIKYDFTLLFLIIGFLLVGWLDYHNQRYPEVCYAYIIPMSYVVGKLVVGQDTLKANYIIEKLYFSLAAGMFIAAFMDFMSNYMHAATLGFSDNFWPSFWLGGIIDNRCTYEFGFFLITASTGYLIYCSKRNVFSIIIAIVLNIIIQKLVIDATGRENRAILPAVIILFVVLIIYDNWQRYSDSLKQRVYNGIRIIFVISVLLFFAILINLFGLREIYQSSIWGARTGFINNVRFSMDIKGFRAMLQYPLEDYESYAGLARPHSMLLEYGRVYDLTVWGLFSIARLFMIKDAIVFAATKNDKAWIKYLLFPAFVAVNIYYSMEPNGYAHRHFWMVGLFISGMIRGWMDINNIDGSYVLDAIRNSVNAYKTRLLFIAKVVLCMILVIGVYNGIKHYNEVNKIQVVEEIMANSSLTLDSVNLEKVSIHTVNPNGSADFKTISDAIIRANDDDIILIYPGVYEESIRVNEKRIHFLGTDKEKCILAYPNYDINSSTLKIAKGSVSNLTIRATAYGTEADSHACTVLIEDDNSVGESLKFSNVDIYNDYVETVCIGLRPEFTLEFDKCNIVSSKSAALYCHDWETDSDADKAGQCLIIKNSTLKSDSKASPTLLLQSQELQTGCAECIFINNKLINQNGGELFRMMLWQGRLLTNDQFMGSSDWKLGAESALNNTELLNAKN